MTEVEKRGMQLASRASIYTILLNY